MTAAPVSLAFFDPAHELHGAARAGVTLLFEGAAASALPGPPEVSAEGAGYRVRLEDRLELEFTPLSAEMTLAGAGSRISRVRGTVGGRQIDCLGTITETHSPPSWAELTALRSLSLLFDAEHAVLAVARRPREAGGHGEELVSASLLAGSEPIAVEQARISTVYDGEGRQRSAGLELWLPGEDFPRRASGTVTAGTSLKLEGLRVNAAVFAWRMEGREGAGAYDLMVRDLPAAAA